VTPGEEGGGARARRRSTQGMIGPWRRGAVWVKREEEALPPSPAASFIPDRRRPRGRWPLGLGETERCSSWLGFFCCFLRFCARPAVISYGSGLGS
jgi:hypothetical protein